MKSEAEQGPGDLLNLGLSFWRGKALLSAVELGVFGALADRSLDAEELSEELGLHPRAAQDFFDVLVALKLLRRTDGRYENSVDAERYLVPKRATYIGGALEMANARLYGTWGKLTDALRTGLPQNEAKAEEDYYGNLNRDEERLETFLRGMTGLSMLSAQAIAAKFPWSRYRTFVDIGGAQGVLSVQLALSHDHLTGITFELPAVEPHFRRYVEGFGLQERLHFQEGDFFRDELPSADVLVMGHVLHNWNLEQKRLLVRKAYDALRPGGVLVVYEALIDDERRENAFGLLMSLNMLLVTQGGFVFTGAQCREWMAEAGFTNSYVEHLQGSDSMVVGVK